LQQQSAELGSVLASPKFAQAPKISAASQRRFGQFSVL
jgi:hypothetical protein